MEIKVKTLLVERKKNRKFTDTMYENKVLLERYTKEAVNQVFKKKGGLGIPIQKLIHIIVTKYKIDIFELMDYKKNTLKQMPDISHKNLSILLLLRVANNSQNKRMSRIAKEMLKENWWAKNGKKTTGDIYIRFIEFLNRQNKKDLLKEILFQMIERIIDVSRCPSNNRNQI